MKRKISINCMVMAVAVLFMSLKTQAQAYIDYSKYAGGTGADGSTTMEVVNGEAYVLGVTTSTDFPVTNSSVYKGNGDVTLTKYSSTGTVLYSTYLGSTGQDYISQMKIINGEVYLTGVTNADGYPVTNGTVYKGGYDIVFTKLNSNGGIVYSTYFGSTGDDFAGSIGLIVTGNEVLLAGYTGAADFPVTGGSTFNGGYCDIFIMRLNASNGNILQSKFIGGSDADYMNYMYTEGGAIYLICSSSSKDLPITIGNPPVNNTRHILVTKLNSNNLGTVYLSTIGDVQDSYVISAKILNGAVHFTGFTYSHNYPVTNGSTSSGNTNGDGLDGIYTRLDPDGSIGFSTYLATDDLDYMSNLVVSNNEVYIFGIGYGNTYPPEDKLLIYKLNANGTFVYFKSINNGMIGSGVSRTMEVVNGEVYFSCITFSPNFPVTNGSQYSSGTTGVFAHLNSTGDIEYASFLGKMKSLTQMKYANNKFYILGSTDIADYPVTDSSVIKGNDDNILIILNPDGSNYFSGYIGGDSTEIPITLSVSNTDVFLSGRTFSNNYPVTNTTLYQDSTDQFITKLSFCPTRYDITNDSLSPKTQAVCKYGLGEKITGKRIIVPSDSLPAVYRNGTVIAQRKAIEATYQWQKADTPAGPWTDIPDATFKDYRPVIGAVDQYYRRLSFVPAECGGALLHISDTAAAIVNSLTAPTLNTGGKFITCTGSAVVLGGSPTAAGGNPPYVSYEWDMGAGTSANPTVNPASSTVYTLTVTDNLGCKQIGQAVVLTYKANAGIDKGSCAGAAVKIGSAQIPGEPGITYSWLPAAGLNNNSIAQPYATPSILTNYVLTLSVAKTGGSVCSTKDSVKITPVPAPLVADFAGPDRVICLKDMAQLGLAPEPGFNYVWSPGLYLTGNTASLTTYYPGNLLMPVPNPAYINLTAQQAGCSFTDRVEVATIEANAGLDGCGPRNIGSLDRTPSINETYQWTLVSGPGSFTGPTDQPIVSVSESVGGKSVYGLTVSYKDGSCYDEVEVPASCNGCIILIDVDAKYKCPSFGVNGGDVTLTAISGLQGEVTYSWSPQEGLDNYTNAVVHLTDNVSRTYFVIATSVADPSLKCFGGIMVNNPAASIPVFPASNITICKEVYTNIGVAPVAGYKYEWEPVPGLSDYYSSNPAASLSFNTSFPVKISDMADCQIRDTINVEIQHAVADAGQDWVICNNSVAKLGAPALPNTTYEWEPQASPWQNGTNQSSAQPEVLAATDLQYYLTATSTIGCIARDTVNVTINNTPAIGDASDTFFCAGKNVVIGLPALPGVTYQWSPATGLNNANIAQPTANPAVATTYTLIANFPGSCSLPASDQVTVRVSDPRFNIPDISFCPANGAVALGTNAPPGMISYFWEPTDLVTNYSIANPSTVTTPPNKPTTFSLTVLNSDFCVASDSVTITPLLSAPMAGTDKIICKNATALLGSSTNATGAGITYKWNPATYLSDDASANPTFTGATGGAFTYILTKTIGGCSSTDTVAVKVIDSLLAVINAPTVCQNSCVQIGVQPVIGVTYQWSPATGLSGVNIANPVACVGSSTTNYTVKAIDNNGCIETANVVIGVNPLPAAQINIPLVTACVGDTAAQFKPVINPAGTYAYSWSPDDGTLSNINIANPTIIITGSGNRQYTLQVTDTVSGCSNTAVANIITNTCTILATVGDFMWFDNNSNGLQDNGELGVSNMSVKLYNNAGILVAATATDANGNYIFTNVSPGNNFYIVFSKPTGYSFTTQNVGGIAATNNSKADATGKSSNFTIAAGANILNIDAGIIPTGATPVMLLSFTGRLQNDRTALLNWQTTAEYNNDYFEIERSQDGIHFIVIDSVDGNGTSSLPHSYSWLDLHPLSDVNYYRLKQVDFDGHYKNSPVVRIEVNNNRSFTAFYNDYSKNITIHFNTLQSNTVLKLFAANGQLIKAAVAKNINYYTMELPALAAGIYLLHAADGKKNYTEKIYINR
ncbi:MAG: SdrD B-like domain-containing protein [Ferruginibacter sp.]